MDDEMVILWIDLTLVLLALLILVSLSCLFSRDKEKVDNKLKQLQDGLTVCHQLIRTANWTHVAIIDVDRWNTGAYESRDAPSPADADGSRGAPAAANVEGTKEVPGADGNGEEDGDVTIRLNVEDGPEVMRNQTEEAVCAGNGETQF